MGHKTTREHYNKYEAMRKAAHVTLVGSTLFGTREQLQVAYDLDPALNSIPLRRFDALYRCRWSGFSLCENTCMYKHCIIYDVLQMTPEFET